jgi:UDP-glucose-4-epimerase GalE
MKPAILVTGGAGYIGSVTCKALARAGYLPVVYDNLSRGHRWAVKWGPLEEHDLKDRKALRSAFRTYKPVAVLHFAAYASVGESMSAPDLYFQNNVVNSLTLLECMRECGVGTIVFSSSCATYGLPVEVPIKDSHPLNPINPYGESKRAVEAALHWYGVAHGLKWTALRYFNAAGADPNGDVGEDHSPETHLIPIAIEAALGLRSHVDVYGTDYPTSDGTAIRDYVHVTDLAEAHVRALEYILQDGESRAFNLGTGRGYSVRDVVRAVERATGIEGISRNAERRPGDPPELVADASAARRILRWQPQCSDLETIVRNALDWHASRLPTTSIPFEDREPVPVGLA